MSEAIDLPPRPRVADLPAELQPAVPRPNRWRHWGAALPPEGFSFDELINWHVAIARCETEIVVGEHQDRAEQTWDFLDRAGVATQRRTSTALDGSFAGFEINRRPERSVTTELVLYGPGFNECLAYPSRGMAPLRATSEIPFRIESGQVATTMVSLDPQLVDVRTLDERRGAASVPGALPLVHALPPPGPMGYAFPATVPLIARQLGCSEQDIAQRFAIVDATEFIGRLTRLPAGRPLVFLGSTGEAARVLANFVQQVLVADGLSPKTVAYFNGSVADWLSASSRRPQVEVAPTVSRTAAPTPSDPSTRWHEWVLDHPDDLTRVEGWCAALNRERDPRGRFIELQLATERSQAKPSQEEQRLLDAHWREWCGGLAGMQREGLVFRRGLLRECRYAPTGEGLDALVWKSVRRLEFVDSGGRKPCTELASPHLAAVELIEGADPLRLEALLTGGPKAKVKELGCIHLSNRSRHVERLSLFPNLKVLRSWYGSATPDDLGQSVPLLSQLERLEFVSDQREQPALPNLAIALERAGVRRPVFVRNASRVEYELRPRELIIRFPDDAVFESEHMWVARALMHHVKAFDRVDGFVGKRQLGFFARRKLTQLMRESLARG